MCWQALKSNFGGCVWRPKLGPGPGAHAASNGCPWNEDACASAAYHNEFEVLKWLHANGCPWDGETLREAERMEHYDIAEWARANGCPEPISQSAFGGNGMDLKPGCSYRYRREFDMIISERTGCSCCTVVLVLLYLYCCSLLKVVVALRVSSPGSEPCRNETSRSQQPHTSQPRTSTSS